VIFWVFFTVVIRRLMSFRLANYAASVPGAFAPDLGW
jgi:hypothetical protein